MDERVLQPTSKKDVGRSCAATARIVSSGADEEVVDAIFVQIPRRDRPSRVVSLEKRVILPDKLRVGFRQVHRAGHRPKDKVGRSRAVTARILAGGADEKVVEAISVQIPYRD